MAEIYAPNHATDPAVTRSTLAVYGIPFLVTLAALALGTVCYLHYREYARLRWDSVVHDRNAHYLLGLSVALDLQQANVKQLWSDLDGARTWPPLHGLLEALVLFVGGRDYRLAVLPSLAGWIGAIVLGFLVARRMAPVGGTCAGLLAALFLASSPAHHAYATDTMLESLGAFWSLLALYLYLVAVQSGGTWAWRGLGLALTALFLHKYNYWLLVAFALTAAELSALPRERYRQLFDWIRHLDVPGWLRAQLKHPLTYVFAVLVVLSAVVLRGGGQTIHLGTEKISLHSPHNVLHLTFAVLCLRVALAWWPIRHELNNRLDERTRGLLLCHALPLAGWFLLPKRLGYWLLYMNPSTNAGEVPQHGVLTGIDFYWQSLVRDYHVGLWSAALAAGLFLLSLLSLGKLRPGSRAVLFLVLIALPLTIPHPNRKSRFLHSWIAAGWVCAGVGLASLVHGRLSARTPRARPWLAAAAVGGIALAHGPGLTQAGHSPEKGHCALIGSTRDLSDYYLPFVEHSRGTTFLSTVEMKHVARWSVLERLGRRERLDADIKNFGTTPDANRRAFDHWLATTPCDTVVFIDIPLDTYFYEPTSNNEAYARLREMLAQQSVFQLSEQRAFGRYGCVVSIWKK